MDAYSPISNQDAAFGTQGSFSVLSFDAASQLNDVSLELLICCYLDHQPFQVNRFVSIRWRLSNRAMGQWIDIYRIR